MLHVRIDEQTKDRATDALATMGMSVSDAVRIFLHRIARDKAFPLELKVPNAETREAMAESDAIVRSRRARFGSAEELFESLEKARGE
jgi:DNA-damage-inducible protein J